MTRKRKTEQPVNEANTTTTTVTAEPPSGMPAGSSSGEPLPVEHTPVEQSFVDRFANKMRRAVRPDPVTIALDNAAGVRLSESRRDGVMAIQLDEKPDQAILEKLKEAGFRWNPADRVWTQPVRSGTAMATRIDAERLYQDIRQMIRPDKGLDAGQDIPF